MTYVLHVGCKLAAMRLCFCEIRSTANQPYCRPKGV